jgi:segregation and condensation protein B
MNAKQESMADDGETTVSEELFLPGVEAVLVAADRPLTAGRIAEAMGLDAAEDGPGKVAEAITTLNQQYEATGRAFRIEKVAGGFRVMTLPEHARAVAAIRGPRDGGRISRAALETLSIVAYRQPITRAELEAIRGVACGEVLRTLLERRLVSITGRAEEPGRPILYGTSKRFLEVFGLSSVKDLPSPKEIAGTEGSA